MAGADTVGPELAPEENSWEEGPNRGAAMIPHVHPDIEALHAISEILIDQVRLYERAAAGVANRPEAEVALAQARKARQDLLGDVNSMIRQLGDTPDIRGTALGASHKSLLKGRAVIGKKNKAVLEDAERGEDYLCDALDKRAADATLSEPTRAFFRDLLIRARPVHDEIALLKTRH